MNAVMLIAATVLFGILFLPWLAVVSSPVSAFMASMAVIGRGWADRRHQASASARRSRRVEFAVRADLPWRRTATSGPHTAERASNDAELQKKAA